MTNESRSARPWDEALISLHELEERDACRQAEVTALHTHFRRERLR